MCDSRHLHEVEVRSRSRVPDSCRGGSASLVGLKRRRDTKSKAGNTKKRVTHDTFVKWKRDLDRECQTITWLDCERSGIKRRWTTLVLCSPRVIDNLRHQQRVILLYWNRCQGKFHSPNILSGGYIAAASSPSPKELLPTESSDISFFIIFFTAC